MFSRTFRIFIVALIVFCVFPIAALAQDGSDSPADREQSQMIPFSLSNGEFISPATLQTFREAGLSESEISELQNVVMNQPAHSSEYSQAQSDMTN